jgi:hypothetical protein
MGVPQWGVFMLVSPRGSYKWIPPSRFPKSSSLIGVAQDGPTKCGPPRGLPRGPQFELPSVVLRSDVSQNGFPIGVPPRGVSQGNPPHEVTKRGPPRGPQDVSHNWSHPRRSPMGVPDLLLLLPLSFIFYLFLLLWPPRTCNLGHLQFLISLRISTMPSHQNCLRQTY